MSDYRFEFMKRNELDCLRVILINNSLIEFADTSIPLDDILEAATTQGYMTIVPQTRQSLDYIDACMQYLGSSLNLLDPDGTFKGMPSQEVLTKIMQAVREDYRKLSDAIHALRQEVQDDLIEGDTSRES